MTGRDAKLDKRVDGAHTAWDGYIPGRTVELIPGKRTVQSWRTTQFAGEDPDSTIAVELAPAKTGTRMTLTHTGVPDGQTNYEKGGWQDNYFAPMKAYFAHEKTKERPAGKPARKA
jgi:activator of HSP90 ATPase